MRRINDLDRRAEQAARQSAAPEALHARALIDLLYRPGVGKSLRESISNLQTAARLADRPAPVLADLAAAFLVRAERDSTPRDLLAAVEAAEQALEREPRNRAALFNRALALQRFGLSEEAARDWRVYLAADSTSGWADEARWRLHEALGFPALPAPPPPEAPEPAYAAYAAADPQGGRVLGWCRVLGAWAEAALQGDESRAEGHLRRAEALAAALERRPGGDATLADGVQAVRAAVSRGTPRTLARAHRDFAAGCALEDQLAFESAAPRFSAAADAAGASPALRAWAWLLYGRMRFHAGDAPGGEAVLREVIDAADPVRHPALAARARLTLASLRVRGDRYEAALGPAGEAARLFAGAGERENEGAALETLGNARFFLREMDEGYASAHRALERLRADRTSKRLHGLLFTTAQVTSGDGFARAAVRVASEGVRVAGRTGYPASAAEAHLGRAKLLAAARLPGRAREDVAAGRRAIERLTDANGRAWMTAERQFAEAVTSLRADPGRAAGALDSASAFFLRMRAPLRAFPAQVAGAEAQLAAGDVAEGSARLEHALALLERRRDSIRMEQRRAAVFDAARAVVDRVVMLRLASGRTAEALAYLDRGRAVLAPVGRAEAADTERAVAGPPGEVAVAYTLVGDTLLAWTVAGSRVDLYRTRIDTVWLVHTIERLRSRLEQRAGEAEVRPALSELYDRLVRPIEEHLGGAGTPLAVIADGDLLSVPFAALHDSRRGRYVVEEHPLRFAVSLREARRGNRGGDAPQGALLVADPAFDRREHDGLERLAQAAMEVRAIAPEYPAARVLADRRATRQAVEAGLARAGVVHYAGHAVFDDERPERSHLVLAPTPGRAGSGRLTADDLSRLDLRHTRLVVLAACQTVRSGRGRAAGYTGLAGSLLAAGAGGAVGSLWEVDDELTRPLMVEFHRAYRASGNGPGALRAAQLRLLASGDETLRSPAAWAGFRYAGS